MKVDQTAEYVALESVVGRWRLRVLVNPASIAAGRLRWFVVATAVSRKYNRPRITVPNAQDGPLLDCVSEHLRWVRAMLEKMLAPAPRLAPGEGAGLERAMRQVLTSLWAVEFEISEGNGVIDARITPWGITASTKQPPVAVVLRSSSEEELISGAIAALRELIVTERSWGTSKWGPRISVPPPPPD